MRKPWPPPSSSGRCSTPPGPSGPRGGACAHLARGGLGVRRGDVGHARHARSRACAPARARRRSRSSATSTRSASRSRTSRRTACSRSRPSAASRPRCWSASASSSLTASGRIPGAIARKRIPPEQMRDRPRLELADLHIDIGAQVARGGRERSSASATSASGTARRSSCRTGACSRRALDNRLGAYVALEAARRIAEASDAQVDVVAVAAVQEEIGLVRRARRGVRARPAGRDRDRRHAGDGLPGRRPEARRADRARHGRDDRARPDAEQAGRPTCSREAAEAEGIPHAFEVYARTTSTDADELHLARAGIPTGLLSIPTRYLHTPNELCDLDDVEAVIRADRRVREAPRHATTPSSADGRPQRHRQRRPHAVREARRRAREATRRPSSARSRSRRRSSGSGSSRTSRST